MVSTRRTQEKTPPTGVATHRRKPALSRHGQARERAERAEQRSLAAPTITSIEDACQANEEEELSAQPPLLMQTPPVQPDLQGGYDNDDSIDDDNDVSDDDNANDEWVGSKTMEVADNEEEQKVGDDDEEEEPRNVDEEEEEQGGVMYWGQWCCQGKVSWL